MRVAEKDIFMKKKLIFIKNYNSYVICSGISCEDFLKTCGEDKNILVVKGDCMGGRAINGFEVFYGIDKFIDGIKDNCYGDLCFMDFEGENSPEALEYDEIADMLYCAHMFKGKKVFYEALKNTFYLLAHDNDFYVKIYYRDESLVKKMINGKITSIFKERLKRDINNIPEGILNSLTDMCRSGLLIDCEYDKAELSIICKAEAVNADDLYNNIENIRNNCKISGILNYRSDDWELKI